MEPLTSIGEAKQAITVFMMAHGVELPEATRDHLLQAISEPSPVVMLVDVMEALYASTDKTSATMGAVARLADFIVPNAWHGINDDSRGTRIIQAMRRDMGVEAPEGVTWPTSETDPAPEPRFAAAVVPSEPVPAPGPVPPAE